MQLGLQSAPDCRIIDFRDVLTIARCHAKLGSLGKRGALLEGVFYCVEGC